MALMGLSEFNSQASLQNHALAPITLFKVIHALNLDNVAEDLPAMEIYPS